MVAASVVTFRRPRLYPKQQAAIFCPERFAVIEASTKSGKTVGCIAWILELIHSPKVDQDGRNYWWVAPILAQAKIAFRRILRWLPRRAPGYVTVNRTDYYIRFSNGATLWFKSADNPDSLYGEDVYGVVIDEASRQPEEAWTAIRSTLSYTRGPARIIGNVKGRKNWAYRLARRAESGAKGWAYYRITAADAVAAGVLAQEEVDDARETIPAAAYQELYDAIASDDQGNPFGLDALRACYAPLSASAPAAWGWDLARKQDWTVGVAFDEAGRMCRLERWQKKPWPETIEMIATHTGEIPALIDATGVGDPIVQFLQSPTWRMRNGTMHREAEAENMHAYILTQSSKQMLLEHAAVEIQQGHVSLADDPTLTAEFEAFEYVYTRTGVSYSAPEGMHDDIVIAAALGIKQHGEPRFLPRSIIAQGSARRKHAS